jgi:hypothetical protein
MEEFKSIGFTVEPAFQEGKSPYMAEFTIECGTIATDFMIDFKDGSEPVSGMLELEGNEEDGYKRIVVEHEYTYKKGASKYSGHSFYPEITIFGKAPDGSDVENEFNTAEKGRCLSIIVNTE